MYRLRFIIAALALAFPAWGQPVFIPNAGQWTDDFVAQMKLSNGAYFFQPTGYRAIFINPNAFPEHGHEGHDHGTHEAHQTISSADAFAFFCNYIGSNPQSTWHGEKPEAGLHHYLIGDDVARHRSGLKHYQSFVQREIYPGVDLRMDRSPNDQAKSTWVVHPRANARAIQWTYEGLTPEINAEGQLVLNTTYGPIIETAPYAFQMTPRGIKEVRCNYEIDADGTVRFNLGRYRKDLELYIDPILVFSSLSGSSADNWGYTATFDDQGNLYGGGIVFDFGYPTTAGALDPSYNDPPGSSYAQCDMGLTKFSSDGTTRIYSTYIGGNSTDQPHSMIVNHAGDLIILGTTGSANVLPLSGSGPGYSKSFTSGGAYGPAQNNPLNMEFPNGVDILLLKINPTGTAYTAATYLGNSGWDGLDVNIRQNYGDVCRGEVVVDDQDKVYIVSTTTSSNFPGALNAKSGSTDAIAACLSSDLSTIQWSRYLGGGNNEAGYGIKVAPNGKVFVAGSTNSTTLPTQVNTHFGGLDGFLMRLSSTGAIEKARYLGSNQVDLAFFVDLDKHGAVYTFGQTKGNYPITSGAWSPGVGGQFVHKLNADLNQTIFSTRWGTANGQPNIVPTAFNIDACLNILMSGWGGAVNGGAIGGSTSGLMVTTDAIQSTTDGSDFYFFVLEANAVAPLFASFFGGSSNEHVDGGTSRFAPDGTIYQAVCASCSNGSFPTTPGVVGSNNPGPNCNLGVIKIDFETSVSAVAEINYDSDVDTLCEDLRVTFTNNSTNAHAYFWDFGNGTTSSATAPTTTFTKGTWTVKLVAIDTICDIADSTTLEIVHTEGLYPTAQLRAEYFACDRLFAVELVDESDRGHEATWYLGDGSVRQGDSIVYHYNSPGTYQIMLIARDTVCDKYDTAYTTVTYDPDWPGPDVEVAPDTCWDGRVRVNVSYGADTADYTYIWQFPNGVVDTGRVSTYRLPETGQYIVKLLLIDSTCNATYAYEFDTRVIREDQRVWIPNTFTPNGDGINELFAIGGNDCWPGDRFVILNSFGNIVFETDEPFKEFWDGQGEDDFVQQDTYVWYFETEDGRIYGTVNVIY